MCRTGVCIMLGLTLTGFAGGDDDPELARLRARIERLEAENEALRETLNTDPDAKAAQARLVLDVRLLHHLDRALKEKPHDRTLRSDAAELARRVAPQSPGNRLVWGVLLETKVLEDGMTVEQAEKLLGPATDRTRDRIGWYFNPDHRRHVAPYLGARITEKGLAEWRLINR